MGRKQWVILAALAIVVVLLAGGACARFSGIRVEVGSAETAPLVVTLSTDGVVEAIAVNLAPEAAGTLVELYVDEGDTVNAGQVLALVGDEKAGAAADEARAAFEVAVAQVQIASAELDFQSTQSAASVDAATATVGMQHAQLAKAKAGSRKQEIAQAEAAVSAAEAQVEAARAGHAATRIALQQTREAQAAQMRVAQAELDAAQSRLAKANAGARDQEIRQARAARDAAAAESHNLQLQYKRAVRLHAQGALSQSALDDAEAAMLAARAQEQAAGEALDLLLAGVRAEDIAAAEAQVESARGLLAQAKAAERNVDVRQKELQAAEAQIARSQAALKQSLQYADMIREGLRPEDIRTQEQRLALAHAEKRAALASTSTTAAARQKLNMAIAEQKRAAAALRAARANLSDTVITSPINGIVATKLIEAGEIVAPQTPILLLVNNTDVWVIADVDDEDISRVHTGQTVKVLCEAYQDRTFRGEVVRVGGAAMPKGVGRVKAKIVRVKIHVTNAAPLLKPGMAVDIEADAEVKKNALLVPADAVVEEATETFIYVVRDGRAHRTVVETGFSNYTQTEIIAGLSSGDRVVVSGKDELSDGVRVRPRAAPDNSEELSKAGGS